MQDRRPYKRQTVEKRRDDLIAATLELVAENGVQGATVRAIADRAGVTPGLIRHYFVSKEVLTRTAYEVLMQQMISASSAVLSTAPDDPIARLAAFVVASISPPVVDPIAVGLWASFLHDVRRDKDFRDAHASSYIAFRDVLQDLISKLPNRTDARVLRQEAIACNAVIDGLWLEGSVYPEGFEPGEIVEIGLRSVGLLLGVTLNLSAPRALQNESPT